MGKTVFAAVAAVALAALACMHSAPSTAAILHCTPNGGSVNCSDAMSDSIGSGVTTTVIVNLPPSITVDHVTYTGASAAWTNNSYSYNNVASLNLATKTTNCNATVQATAPSTFGNLTTLAFVADSGSKAGSLTDSAGAVTFHFKDASSQVSDFLALLPATDLKVQTPGTTANVLHATVDEFAATPLGGAISNGNQVAIAATNTGSVSARLTAEISFSPIAQYVVDFETGDLSQSRQIQSCAQSGTCATTSVQVSTSSPTPEHGTYAGEFVCNISDPPVAGHDHRSEILVGPLVPVSSEYWYGFASYIPSSWGSDDSSCVQNGSEDPASNCTGHSHYHLLSQWHTANTDAQVPLALNLHDDTIQWQVAYGYNVTSGKFPVAVFTTIWSDAAPAYKNAWTKWAVHAFWDTDPTVGYIDIYKNGVLVEHYANHTLTPGGGGVYWKAGLTYELNESRGPVYLDEMRMVGAQGGLSTVEPL